MFKFLQQATLWEPNVRTGYGTYTYKKPKSLLTRWEDKNSLFINSKGEEERAEAIIYMDYVPLKESYLYKGESTEEDPPLVSHKIKSIEIIPNLKNNKKLVKVSL